MREVLAESRAVVLTAHALARDLMTAEAVEALRRVGVRSIVLKGPSIARWLYADGCPRPYTDSDLLVSPGRLRAAAGALESIGYSLVFDDRVSPAADAHHLLWQRDRDGATVALHAMQHAPERGKPLEDLRRGLRLADESCWRTAARLAAELGAQDAFAAG